MIRLRKAAKEDSEFIAKMILMALHIDIVGKELFLSHMKELVESDRTLYHWSRCVIAEYSGNSVGMILAYNGMDYHRRRIASFSFVCSDGTAIVEGDNRGLLSQPDESGRGEFYIDSLAVLPDCRGRGVGRMLLTDAIKRGRKMGLTPSILVLPDNYAAVKLYEGVGFRGKEEMRVFGDCYCKMKCYDD